MEAVLHIVLFEPEIPPNTGNIARLCACTGAKLHLVHPLGFDINDKQLRRAGLDYWQHLQVQEHENWQALQAYFQENMPTPVRMLALTTKTDTSIWDVQYQRHDVLVFGPESRGLPAYIRDALEPVTIPMRKDAPVRSLNLSSACAVVTYEALRQINRA